MDRASKEQGASLYNLRKNSAAWQLLASPRAPLIVTCLRTLFEPGRSGTSVESMEQALAEILAEYVNSDDTESGSDFMAEARRELREWIKRRLIIERQGYLVATDDLQRVILFVDGLQDRIMTSTASRLATVQREIENLAVRLNPDRAVREDMIVKAIARLQEELEDVQRGEFEVLEGSAAEEGIREVYDLAMSLRADFRRVEDSYRDADKVLRQSIISDAQNRGEVVEKLLDSHDQLVKTPEGQVFAGFHQQLTASAELDKMNQNLRKISKDVSIASALDRHQRSELGLLTMRLVSESKGVIRARARSERDVKGFIKTGLAAEHLRVGQLLNELLEAAFSVDWQRQSVRRTPVNLPCIAVAIGSVPVVQRLLIKEVVDDDKQALTLLPLSIDLEDIDAEFWESFNSLDQRDLFDQTLQFLHQSHESASIGDLAIHLASPHDLEAVTFWLSIAKEAGLATDAGREVFEVAGNDGQLLRYDVPRVAFTSASVKDVRWEIE
jgi:hypothetical protein